MKKNAIVFGTGYTYELIKTIIFSEYNIVSLIDNNQEKCKTVLDGVKILNPKTVINENYDVIIIAASHIVQMAKQLVVLGVSTDEMVVGVNYAIAKDVASSAIEIKYTIDEDCNMICSYKNIDEDLIRLNIFNNKKLLLTSHDLPTLLGLYDHNNLNEFLNLSSRYNNNSKGVFLDIGANIGTSSIEAIEHANVTECIAFEPSSDNYSLLMSNIFINKLHNKITGYNYAVGDKNNVNKLILSPAASGDNRLRKDTQVDDCYGTYENTSIIQTEDVKTIVIDDFLSDKLNDIQFMWIDVQGYEFFVLKGCERLIKNSNVSIQIEYWPLGLKETNSLKLLNEYLVKHFKYFIDMDEYRDSKDVIHGIKEIFSLEDKLSKINKGAHTDIFLIR